MTRQDIIDYCLTFPATYEDYPFVELPGEDNTTVMRHRVYKKSFALIMYHGGKLHLNLKCDPLEADFLRQAFEGVIGDVIGQVSDEQLRRVQIRETILSHLERERQLFPQGIKVLSLFFIDEVAKYKQYDTAGKELNGPYAEVFEEEYRQIVDDLQLEITDTRGYLEYLSTIAPGDTHKGYFSIDKKNRQVDSKLGDRKERTSDDIAAYDLIMKAKERLLDLREPVRFIFSHSALREGWDNPNVFQICTLKQSGSEIRKRQEVGRGLRLSVDQSGQRMDTGLLGEDVHNVNTLTIVASESYENFALGLQNELAEAIGDRPQRVSIDLFKGKVIKDSNGAEQVVDIDLAQAIYDDLVTRGYVKKGTLTEQYYEDKKNGRVKVAEEIAGCEAAVVEILDSVYDVSILRPADARANNVTIQVDDAKLGLPEFKKLWERINAKSFYTVQFSEEELIGKAIDALNRNLRIAPVIIKVESGEMTEIESREKLQQGEAFGRERSSIYKYSAPARAGVKFDLVGKIVAETGLTRRAVATILRGIDQAVFKQFGQSPEEFIIKAAALINEEKATTIIQHITYNKLDAVYSTNIFTEPSLKGQLGVNAIPVKKHLYNHILYDSEVEKNFAENVDASAEVAVYIKLPRGFYISTPVGKYTPDWAIAFYEGKVKHIYFVAETKGSMSTLQLMGMARAKAHCAREHFRSISTGSVVYDVVDSYTSLLEKVMG